MSWKSYDWRKSGCRIRSDTIHPEEKRNNWGSKISPLIEKLEPYIKPYITKIDDAVGHVQKQIRQAVQKAGGVVDDTFRLELVAGESIETLGKDVVQESGEAAGRRILHEESGTVEEIQAVVTEGGETGGDVLKFNNWDDMKEAYKETITRFVKENKFSLFLHSFFGVFLVFYLPPL